MAPWRSCAAQCPATRTDCDSIKAVVDPRQTRVKRMLDMHFGGWRPIDPAMDQPETDGVLKIAFA